MNVTVTYAEIIQERTLRHLFKANEILSSMLLSYHNLHFLVHTMQNIREAIEQDRFTEYKREFYMKYDDYSTLL